MWSCYDVFSLVRYLTESCYLTFIVCRILVTELMIELNKTANVKDTLHLTNRLDDNEADNDQKAIDYQKS